MRRPSANDLLALLAFGTPMLLAVNLPPSPTLFNQCVAIGLQGAWITQQCRARSGSVERGAHALLAALAAYALGVLAALAWGLPITIATGLLGVIACAVLAVVSCANRPEASAVPALRSMAFALMVAGMINALIGAVQVFA